MSARPSDGQEKKDSVGCDWIACCGVWFSTTAWVPPAEDVERDPEEAARTHRVLPADEVNCPECRRSLRRYRKNLVDASRVLAISALAGEADLERAYARRLRDVEGTWIRFGPTSIEPRQCRRLRVEGCYEPVKNVSFLALPESIASKVRVMTIASARQTSLDGPVPGQCFAVRIPADRRQPIDRGGAIGGRLDFFPGLAFVEIENASDESLDVYGAFFAPSGEEDLGSKVVSIESAKGGC